MHAICRPTRDAERCGPKVLATIVSCRVLRPCSSSESSRAVRWPARGGSRERRSAPRFAGACQTRTRWARLVRRRFAADTPEGPAGFDSPDVSFASEHCCLQPERAQAATAEPHENHRRGKLARQNLQRGRRSISGCNTSRMASSRAGTHGQRGEIATASPMTWRSSERRSSLVMACGDERAACARALRPTLASRETESVAASGATSVGRPNATRPSDGRRRSSGRV